MFSCLRRGFYCNGKLIIPFVLNATFLYRMETSENLRFSDVFRGRKKDVLGTNGLKNIWRYAAEGFRQDEWWIIFLQQDKISEHRFQHRFQVPKN